MPPENIARSAPVWILALGQMLGYACLYYIFPALVVAWHDDTGWSKALLALGPMVAILMSALLAPVMGRQVDLGRTPVLMGGGALLGAAALAGLTLVRTPAEWLALWAVIGIAQSMLFYEVCFAFLVRRLGPAGRAAIIRITLIAGMAGTLAFPAGAALSEAFGWRATVLIAAGMLALILAPLNIWASHAIAAAGPPPPLPEGTDESGALSRALRSRAFWLLAVIFALSALNHWMIVALAIPVFTAQGASVALAVTAAACIGPAQVAGRLAVMAVERRITSTRLAIVTVAASLIASALLLVAGLAPVLIFGFALLQGAAVGIVTILRPVMTAEIMGPAGFGAISGAILIPALVAGAVAPVAGALLLQSFGAAALAGVSLAILLAMLGTLRMIARVTQP